ncbi:hypothetical protein [Aestuariivivens marinum]|uniref:hypothetical protein n=1 Tax=Aestuariivivens marinum TaxID=2913555 RepID=UPI001F56D9F3|nr:hypothetical protein [Aestuariivivens marinum]
MEIKINLFEDQFQRLASKEGVELKKEYEPSYSKLITFMPGADYNEDLRVKTLLLKIPYKEQMISVEYKVGDAQLGLFSCYFKNGITISDFKIDYRSHFLRLIFKNKKILRVRSEDKNLKRFLENRLIENDLETIARESLFTPEIEGVKNGNYLISAFYTLSFEDKEKVLEPMVELYKDIIDWALD